MCPVLVEINCEMDFLVRNASVAANLNLVANSEHNRHVTWPAPVFDCVTSRT